MIQEIIALQFLLFATIFLRRPLSLSLFRPFSLSLPYVVQYSLCNVTHVPYWAMNGVARRIKRISPHIRRQAHPNTHDAKYVSSCKHTRNFICIMTFCSPFFSFSRRWMAGCTRVVRFIFLALDFCIQRPEYILKPKRKTTNSVESYLQRNTHTHPAILLEHLRL